MKEQRQWKRRKKERKKICKSKREKGNGRRREKEKKMRFCVLTLTIYIINKYVIRYTFERRRRIMSDRLCRGCYSMTQRRNEVRLC